MEGANIVRNTITTQSKRNILLDLIKGVSILLVVIGHNIQYGSGISYYHSERFFGNQLFIFIYSFHMPLFMLVSGYLFWNSIKKYESKNLIFNRVITLVVPIVTCTAIESLLLLIQKMSFSVDTIEGFVSSIVYNLWFLWAILFCSIIVILVNKYLNDSLYVYCLIICSFLFLPDNYNLYLYKYMFVYFVSAYAFNKFCLGSKLINLSIRLKILGLFLISLIFFGLLFFYNYDSFVYTSKIAIYQKEDMLYQLFVDLYRWIIGFFGSGFMICVLILFNKISNNRTVVLLKRTISLIGQNSLGIYMISTIFINVKILLPLTKNGEPDLLMLIVETITVLTICYTVTEIIKHFRFTNKFLLGGR
ncbi:acyltransferase family protein [Paenibacillus glycanilyticus]|uniref:acyltransferase family protein n=1 Tax=Paenibacillus glycanilyticus TaxID=126569 RepID=UPI003EBE168D